MALVRATREHADLRLGASPRSSTALYRAAQAWALLDGRGFVLPDDIRDVAHPVLEHRLLLDIDRELRGATVKGVDRRGARGGAGSPRRRLRLADDKPMGGWLALAALMVAIGGVADAPGLFAGRRGDHRLRLADDASGAATGWAGSSTSRSLGTDPGDRRRHRPARRHDLEPQAAAAAVDRRRGPRDRADRGAASGRPWSATTSASAGGSLRNAWALTWFERVVRHFHLDAARRGLLRVRAGAAPACGTSSAATPAAARWPPTRCCWSGRGRCRSASAATMPRPSASGARAAPSTRTPPCTAACARSSRATRCARSTGGPAPGSARTVSRRFEPARGREVVIALDVQTIEGPHWEMTYHDATFEGLCVAAASLARQLLAEGASCGIAAASFTGTIQQLAYLPPRASYGQLPRVSRAPGADRARSARARTPASSPG